MAEDNQIKVDIVFDDKASAALANVKKGMHEAGEETKHHKKEHEGLAHQIFEGATAGVALAEIGVKAGEMFAEGIHEGLHMVEEMVVEAFNAGVEKLAGQKKISTVLSMTGAEGSFDLLNDKAEVFQSELEGISVQAGVSKKVLEEVFTGIASRSNKTALEVTELTKDIAYAGKAIPGGAEALGSGFEMMEMGMIRARNPIVQLIAQTHVLHGNAKSVAAQLQKMSPEKQMQIGEEAIKKMSERMKGMPPTMESLTTSLKEMKEQTLEAVGVPMVAAVVPMLEEAKTWLIANKDAIEEIADVAGEELGATLKEAYALAKDVVDVFHAGGDDFKNDLQDAFKVARFIMEQWGAQARGLAISIKAVADAIGWISAKVHDAAGKGKLGEGAQALEMGSRARGLKEKLTEAATHNQTKEGREEFEKLTGQLRETAGAAGMAGPELEQFITHAQGTADAAQTTGFAVDNAAAHMDPKQFVAVYNQARKAHDEGTEQYVARVLAGSAQMQEAMLKAGDTFEGGFMPLIKAMQHEGLDKQADEFRSRVMKSAAPKTAAPNYNFSGPISIKQDFRDQDPDRILIMFKEDLRRAASSRIMSMNAPSGHF